MRPRVNQPAGYRGAGTVRPYRYRGRRHDYVFFPAAWTDESTGTYYEKGYYDENGTRYDNVSFEKDGRYENVVCHCEYCGQDTILNLSSEEVSSMSLKCPECGAPMEIKSELDEVLDARQDDDWQESNTSGRSAGRPRKRRLLPIIFVIMAVIALIDIFSPGGSNTGIQNEPLQLIGGSGNDDLYDFGDVIRLTKTSGRAYTVTENGSDKKLTWDSDADSYYDQASECWVWYNTDVEPAVWQYWYEGISSDYGDYGWMEHDSTGWYIEASAGNWISLPGKYSTSNLWYIEE